MSEDPGLTRAEVLRAITMNSSYELHQDRSTGSLEVGQARRSHRARPQRSEIPAEEIADMKVLQTVVGGRVVYQSDKFTTP